MAIPWWAGWSSEVEVTDAKDAERKCLWKVTEVVEVEVKVEVLAMTLAGQFWRCICSE